MKTSKIHPVRLCLLLILSYWIASFGSGFIFMKEIQLKDGFKAKVDDLDFEFLNQWKWTTIYKNGTQYAGRYKYIDGVCRTIYMHRQLAGSPGSNIWVDHADHDTLNNQKDNLRLCTQAQNAMNTTKSKNKTSQYKGVSASYRPNYPWHCKIKKDQKDIFIGRFKTEEAAAKAYNKKAKELFGEFANLNILPNG